MSRRRRDPLRLSSLLAAAAAVTLSAQSNAAQADQPVFRAGVQVVEVDARVFDREGRFISDLTLDDFELLEDGIPQRLLTLYRVDGTATGEARVTARADTSATAQPAGRHAWAFVFDLNHLTPGSGFDRARAAVEAFLRDQFREGDLGGVVAGARMVNNRLTSVREELVNAVKSVKPLSDARTRQFELTREWPRLQSEDEALRVANEDGQALERAITRACSDDPDACKRVPPDVLIREKARRLQREIQQATMQTLNAMNALASGFAKMQGPKTIVFLSDGFVTREMETTLRQVAGQISRAGGRIYAIDVRGLDRRGGRSIIEQAVVDDPAGGPVHLDVQEDGPNSLAVDTGGLMIRNENNIGRALDTIARDASRYYVLAYQPANSVLDGKFRSIEVRAKRPTARVRARHGYLALEPSRMLAPLPVSTSAVDTPHTPAVEERPTSEPAAAPPVSASGAVVAAPLPPPTDGVVRLRPDAADRVRQIVGNDPASADWMAHRGWDAYQRGDVEAAVNAFTEAARQPDVKPWVFYALGFSQSAVGRHADAAQSWERVRHAAPEFESIYMDLADAYIQLADLTKALTVLRDAATRWPSNPDIHNAVGVIHVRRGALEAAVAAFSKAIAAAPDQSLAYFNAGRAYEMRFARSRRYVSSQRRWTGSDEDRRKAAESYERYLKLGGPYTNEAAEALARLEWLKK